MLGVRGCVAATFMFVAGVGCSSDSDPVDPTDGPPQEPGTERLITPPMSIPQETKSCTVSPSTC